MVELKKIRKVFSSNGVKALDGADFDLCEGEIHALLGENGAGKSTLMHIMAGFMKPGEERIGTHTARPGRIFVDGKEQRFSSPARALSAGIGMVRQHPHHIPGFLVWESCAVGSQARPAIWMNRHTKRQSIAAVNDRFRFGLPLDTFTERLTVSEGQKAAILALLLRNVRYLIFDEPTAVLSPGETENLFKLFKQLRDEGKGIVLISHKLDETLKLADRITVLRQGKTQASAKAGELDAGSLGELIFGTEALHADVSTSFAGTAAAGDLLFAGPPALVLKDFAVNVPGRPLIRGLSLKLERGRIMGIAGVRDSGLETLELAVTGFLPSSGLLNINGSVLPETERVKAFRDAGGAYLGTRNEEALSIRDMLLIHAHRRLEHRGFLDKKEIKRWVNSIMSLSKVPSREKAASTAFSGGQLQRILITRELQENASLLVLSDPGRGLDRRYRKRLAFLLREKAAAGTAILIFSTDVEELLSLSDSIMVLRNGVFSVAAALTGQDVPAALQETIREAMV
ncbi:ABC transporter [Spirochaetia bacterium]|nr:ABC transporter [Spirochaetia bacterium]